MQAGKLCALMEPPIRWCWWWRAVVLNSDGVKQVTGRVVASNGQNLSQPIVLSNGKGSVPVGQHQVVWTATDNAGNAKSITQTISVIPSFYGTSGVYLPDGVVLKTKLSDRTPFANGFGGQAQLGVAATSGDIWSGGTVWLRDRAHVLGKVFSASTITTQNGVITDGLSQICIRSIWRRPSSFPQPNRWVDLPCLWSPAKPKCCHPDHTGILV